MYVGLVVAVLIILLALLLFLVVAATAKEPSGRRNIFLKAEQPKSLSQRIELSHIVLEPKVFREYHLLPTLQP